MIIIDDETVKAASIERNSAFCIYVEQPLRDVTLIEEKIEFTDIPREYDLNCINIKKLEIMASSQKQKIVLFQDYSIKFVADLVTNKVEVIIDIKDKGLEILRHLEVNKLYFNLTISIPSKTGSSPLIYSETLKKCQVSRCCKRMACNIAGKS
ncbi:MAG: hypothetical protein MR804_08105 [Limosilactobacillus reuteri]|uniref:hypothetical protein n=1 Tax=Limosilactobacillus reuteri TaxID=1598 RepID=UPI001E33BAA3|nr:hypothetical protein [Limosilactobacillus reuteri]MCC4515937.1 hypothetical protein [Limosilactobacillus reuteri]MCI6368845.1 hypothetical protein [Limosilactobacillus reuteri]